MALLVGTRVLDVSQYIPVPYATHLMASLGAEVIKIEPPAGDPLRYMACAEGDDVSPLYRHLNAGKKVVFINLKTPAGCHLLEKLIAQADVMLDGWRPGVLAGLGFDRDRIETLNPNLVYCGLSGFGQTGSDALRAGHDIGYCTRAGLFDKYESPSGSIPFPPIADHVGALQAVNAVLAALLYRQRSKKGCWLDISLYETIFSWQYVNQIPAIRDMLGGGAAYYNMYWTKDDRILTLGAIETKFWSRFCQMLQRHDWIERYHEPLPQTKLIAAVSHLLKSETRAHWLKVFEKTDCCLEAIPSGDALFNHPHTLARGIVGQAEIKYPGRINGYTTPALTEFCEISIDQNFNWDNI